MQETMLKLYMEIILPHFEYAAPLFIGLNKRLSAKLDLESTNAFALRTQDTSDNVLLNVANLRTVPTIVIAHTFCASRDTQISYR